MANTINQVEQRRLADSDLQAHIEDGLIVQRMVNGQVVPCRWNDLTEEERRAAYESMFDPHGFNLNMW